VNFFFGKKNEKRFKDFTSNINFKTKSIFLLKFLSTKQKRYLRLFRSLSLLPSTLFLFQQGAWNICFWLHRHIFAQYVCVVLFSGQNDLQNNRKGAENIKMLFFFKKKCYIVRQSISVAVKLHKRLSFTGNGEVCDTTVLKYNMALFN
jgi:hypothetical protein